MILSPAHYAVQLTIYIMKNTIFRNLSSPTSFEFERVNSRSFKNFQRQLRGRENKWAPFALNADVDADLNADVGGSAIKINLQMRSGRRRRRSSNGEKGPLPAYFLKLTHARAPLHLAAGLAYSALGENSRLPTPLAAGAGANHLAAHWRGPAHAAARLVFTFVADSLHCTHGKQRQQQQRMRTPRARLHNWGFVYYCAKEGSRAAIVRGRALSANSAN